MTKTTKPTADPTKKKSAAVASIEKSVAVSTIAELETRVDQVLDEMRPYIHSHGGEVNVLEVTDEKVARLQMLGSCNGCPMSMLTMRLGIERLLAEKVPELKGAEAVFVDDFEWPEITPDE